MNRPQVTSNDCILAIHSTVEKFHRRRKQKGMGALVSRHEILGVIEEEIYELKKAIHEHTSDDELIEELKDLAVAAIFGIASLKGVISHGNGSDDRYELDHG